MPRPVYASSGDYFAYTGEQVPSVRLLTRASQRVDAALLGAFYPTDPTTLAPIDPEHTDALREATCEQVLCWDEAGDTAGLGERHWSTARIEKGGLTLTRESDDQRQSMPDTCLCPTGLDILRRAGLLPIHPYVTG